MLSSFSKPRKLFWERLNTTEEVDADLPPPPDLRADIMIQDSQGFKFTGTVSAVDPDNIVTMIVTKTRGNVAFIKKEKKIKTKLDKSK